MLRTITVVGFAAALSTAAAERALAAPSSQVMGSHVKAPALLQDARWEYRHHRRVWVPDRHRRAYRRNYGS
jgi:hypothetical protein